MLVSVFCTIDNKFYIYIPYQENNSNKLPDSLPEAVLDKFKKYRFIKTVDTEKSKLIQIKDKNAFIQALKNQGFYIVSIEDDYLESLIISN